MTAIGRLRPVVTTELSEQELFNNCAVRRVLRLWWFGAAGSVTAWGKQLVANQLSCIALHRRIAAITASRSL